VMTPGSMCSSLRGTEEPHDGDSRIYSHTELVRWTRSGTSSQYRSSSVTYQTRQAAVKLPSSTLCRHMGLAYW